MSTPAAAAISSPASAAPSAAATASAAAPVGTAATPAAANEPFWSSWNAPEQKETREWIANKNYADPFTLAKTTQTLEREAASLRAAKGYPSDKVNSDGSVTKADENARRAWNAAVGVPETADKYDIPTAENNPYPQFKTYIAEEFHKAGVPAAMATQLAKGYEAAVTKMETQIREQENTQSEAGLLKLKEDWGANYQERVSFAQRGKEWLSQEVGGMSDVQLRSLESMLGTPKFLSAMWKIGAANREPGFAGSDARGSFGGTASEAQAELDQITADRAANKISDLEWRTKSEKRVMELRDRIVAGMA